MIPQGLELIFPISISNLKASRHDIAVEHALRRNTEFFCGLFWDIRGLEE